ncbi:hydrolase 1, exosortase A system-associated [Novosphingobium guangzhouense]|uniref:Hydrolase 1, exosortase A system-associated n=1 Tax=Novosphingobium guangzhouense TaxID=1850347 RepID=A0A2K2G1Y5_9SPHN|nr:hydrolase 1, exosortase A system-associated [Novosphingobium guangzhouense]PNU05047.1 hydrolase 1, exosortase A system-associated [Novosphingobium guangzhouense]
MTRRHLTFNCAGDQIFATLDDAPGAAALLIVSGGNEIRAGAWNGQALLAARIADAGFPVLRFDRRGIGDSAGANLGFRGSAPDIAAALRALRNELPQVQRIVGFGNCDAAAALMLSRGTGFDALVLSNPWTLDGADDAPSSAVIRDHYRRRLANPAAIRRLLSGKVSLTKLARSAMSALAPSPSAPSGLAGELSEAISGFGGPIRFVTAGRDRTGIAFLSLWNKGDTRIRTFPDATHSYVEPQAQDWLIERVLEMLRN